MNPALRFLILTDHRDHTDQNSLYALAPRLAADPRCAVLHIASRGLPANAAFFDARALTQVQCAVVEQSFAYHPAGTIFTHNTFPATLADYDVVWMRLPHPASEAFLLRVESAAQANAQLIINRPSGLLETGNKAYLRHFAEFCPPLALVNSAAEVYAFPERFAAVLKPLHAHGGNGIVKIINGLAEEDGQTFPLDTWLARRAEQLQTEGYLAMKFLDRVTEGDKRILVVNGKVLGASLRLRPPDGWLCNVAQGGRSVPAEIDAEEQKMIDVIAPLLLAKGVVFFGMDTLVGDDGQRVLSELNTLSIGGFPQAEAQSGRPILQQAIDELFNYCYANR